MPKYEPQSIESKWQKYWDKNQTFAVTEDPSKRKFYALIEFPYPSGAGLHVGHPRPFTAMDVVSRKRRMEGYNVLYPIGFDAFGLPTENFAIKTGRPPAEVTAENIATFTRQLKSLGFGFDWSRVVDTTDPAYYKWTQWIFLQLYKKGLAYKKEVAINWCPKDKIGLANEEVVDGCCERCGTPVEKRNKSQWILAITKYADKLLDGLNEVDYIPQAKIQQEHWIGRSEGAEIEFEVQSSEFKVKVFTTRPDTLFGATYLVVAPEHPILNAILNEVKNPSDVHTYIDAAKKKTDLERTAEGKEKTGVELKGITAINPATGETIPVWTADYVLGNYGTGAIMAVPAHDERDFEFAQKYNLPVKQVVAPFFEQTGIDKARTDVETLERRTVDAIIESVEGGKFLLQVEGDHVHFVGGGAETGEDLQEAMIREVKEETGYIHFEIQETVVEHLQAYGFRHTKNKNQRTDSTVFHVRLLDDERIPSEVEEGKHQIVWAPKQEIATRINWPHHVLEWKMFTEKNIFTEEGILVNSGQFDGLPSNEAKTKITGFVNGKMTTKYRLRDWVFSRQRYWGEPIPLVFCPACKEKPELRTLNSEPSGEQLNPGWIPLPESTLPLTLPKVEKYEPTDNGESPLSAMHDWVNTTCPKCGGPATRETDVMPNWAGSSWYFLRYLDPHNDTAFAAPEKIKYWTPVDWYNGGMEHTVLHLLYSRFWNQFLFDLGLVPTREPYAKRTSHGMILAKGGEKMSKSKGNVINPDDMVAEFGADALRTYIMFMGPFDQAVEWDTNGLIGVRRFLDKVWNLQEKINQKDEKKITSLLHQTIKKVSDDIEAMRFNTAIAKMMELVNELGKEEHVSAELFSTLTRLLAPFAPHIAEELWQMLGNTDSIAFAPWPTYNAELAKNDEMTIVVQVNGKVRDSFVFAAGTSEEEIKATALASEKTQKWLDGKPPKKVIYVAGKLLSIVV